MTERERLARACRTLVDQGLVVRTWGNISVRLDDERMLISPSGLPYESLGPEDFVEVSFRDGSWSGDRKPSSERNLHAAVYRTRGDVGAIVHTHQTFASALAATRVPAFPVDGAEREILGDSVVCAEYSMPTTMALANSVEAIVERTSAPAILLANHGAVTVGSGIDEALEVASALERFAERRVGEYLSRAGITVPGGPGVPGTGVPGTEAEYTDSAPDPDAPADLRTVAGRLAARGMLQDYRCLAVRTDAGYTTAAAEEKKLPAQPELNRLHRDVFARHPGLNAILVSRSPFILACAERGKALAPYLDDAAQLIGLRLRAKRGPFRQGLARRPAVMVPGVGLLCFADSLYDVEAIAIVGEKLAVAALTAEAAKSRAGIPWYEALLMRLIYVVSYRKKASEANS